MHEQLSSGYRHKIWPEPLPTVCSYYVCTSRGTGELIDVQAYLLLCWSIMHKYQNDLNLMYWHIYSNKKVTSDFHGTVSINPVKMSQQK